MSNKKETRAFQTDGIELRKKDETTAQKYVVGVGIVYDREVELWDGYYERIDSSAFKDCLSKNPEIKSFFNHDPNFVLSTTESNPALVLNNKGDGLWFESPIPDTSYGRDLIENLTRNNVKGASFTFSIDKDSVTTDKDGNYHRTIKQATIYEIGPVTNPAFVQTQVSLRDKDGLLEDAKTRTQASDADDVSEQLAAESARRAVEERGNIYRRNLITLLEIDNN